MSNRNKPTPAAEPVEQQPATTPAAEPVEALAAMAPNGNAMAVASESEATAPEPEATATEESADQPPYFEPRHFRQFTQTLNDAQLQELLDEAIAEGSERGLIGIGEPAETVAQPKPDPNAVPAGHIRVKHKQLGLEQDMPNAAWAQLGKVGQKDFTVVANKPLDLQ